MLYFFLDSNKFSKKLNYKWSPLTSFTVKLSFICNDKQFPLFRLQTNIRPHPMCMIMPYYHLWYRSNVLHHNQTTNCLHFHGITLYELYFLSLKPIQNKFFIFPLFIESLSTPARNCGQTVKVKISKTISLGWYHAIIIVGSNLLPFVCSPFI